MNLLNGLKRIKIKSGIIDLHVFVGTFFRKCCGPRIVLVSYWTDKFRGKRTIIENYLFFYNYYLKNISKMNSKEIFVYTRLFDYILRNLAGRLSCVNKNNGDLIDDLYKKFIYFMEFATPAALIIGNSKIFDRDFKYYRKALYALQWRELLTEFSINNGDFCDRLRKNDDIAWENRSLKKLLNLQSEEMGLAYDILTVRAFGEGLENLSLESIIEIYGFRFEDYYFPIPD